MQTNKMKFFIASFLLICSALAAPEAESHDGSPLYLTPYIENGKLSEAKKLSEVTLPELDSHLKSHSGFLTIDKTKNANSFFWFFPAKVRNVTFYILKFN